MNRDQLVTDLRAAEGVKAVVYDDATGHPIRHGSTVQGFPTIGVGHRVDLPLPASIIDAILEWDVDEACVALTQEFPWWTGCTESQQRALVELTFNLGVHGLSTFARFLIHLRAGRGHAAACELASSKWTTQVGPTRSQRIVNQVQT